MPRILVTNDDGIDAPGIKMLSQTLQNLGELFVIAPAEEQSGSSHSLTIGKPVKITEHDSHRIGISGTPTDCVLLAHHSLMNKEIDLVVSGINMGYNLADDVLYSGTVAAAMEGRLLGYPSVAVSADRQLDEISEPSLLFVRQLCRMVLDNARPAFVNINVPPVEPKGVRITRLGKRVYEDVVQRTRDENGEWHLILSGKLSSVSVEGSDTDAIDSGYISVTPLHLDLTGFDEIAELGKGIKTLPICEALDCR